MNAPPDENGTELDRLIEGHLDGTLDDAAEARLGRLVAESAVVAGRLARAVLVHDRLIDLLRGEASASAATIEAESSVPPPAIHRSRAFRLALPLGMAAVLAVGSLLLLRPAPANASASASAALERLVRASAAATDRQYAIRVVDHGPGGVPDPVPADVGGRKPGVDGATLFVRGADKFVFVRTFADGTAFINGCDGTIGWSVPPTGHVHLSEDQRRFRRGIPGERDDLPFLSLAEGLAGFRRGYALSLVEAPEAGGRLRLEAVRTDSRHRGPARATIDFPAGAAAAAERIELGGLAPDGSGPDGVVLELVERAPLPADFFDHAHHHDASRLVDWE
ncbi:MAG: hypothetical protein F2840_18145 [Actinobacteria bacterium]|uniref:Unannotated protein n=1 Tax=freshwater metagenome TaxID=449393 RepID=A0A6J7M3H1_9ZZZZ|nr:hypothetical protein [Actinomycetota bacterium]